MSVKLYYEKLESFVGDVAPLWLESDENLRFKSIKWSVSGEAVSVHSFAGVAHACFPYGVLLTFVKEGEATVTATYEGNEYVCNVVSRARKSAKGEMNYYFGDFHTHTSPDHNHDRFFERTDFLQSKLLSALKEENLLDAAVMTDHSETTNQIDFFRDFTEYEKMKSMGPIVYAGCENEIMYTESDRYGKVHRLSGEIVTVNASGFCQANTYGEFLTAFRDSPYTIGVFAHPHILGISTKGIWDFRPSKHNMPELKAIIKYVEMGDGAHFEPNMMHEYVYSQCLDAGYRVSTTCSSDRHKEWSFNAFPGKTIIMAPEKTREAFTDALLNLRAYACESANVKVSYSVNGNYAPCDLTLAEEYKFSVKLGYFRDDPETKPVKCQVISDYGRCIKVIENTDLSQFDFSVSSSTARWFYLRFVDSLGRKTWSPPVFTGRSVDPCEEFKLSPMDKSKMNVRCAKTGELLNQLINDDPNACAEFPSGTASLVVDMGEKREISAISQYAPPVEYMELRSAGKSTSPAIAVFAAEYKVSVSTNGVDFSPVADGIFRSFAGEEFVKLDKCHARYVKLDVLSTTGKYSDLPEFANSPLRLAEITVY
jgi:hypothetical protein